MERVRHQPGALPLSTDADALKPAEYHGPQVFARGRTPAVKAARALLPDANSLPMWFFDLCNLESPDADRLRIANATFILISATASRPTHPFPYYRKSPSPPLHSAVPMRCAI
jgi:hypothetical protein